jgi:hypothetical protein
MITKQQCVLELENFTYDRLELLEVFQKTKHLARVKGLPWRDRPGRVLTVENAKCVVIQHGEHMMLDESKKDLSCNLLEFDCVNQLVNRLNFNHKITAGNVDIIWYRPGFKFEPHTDNYAYSTMMWPIIPEDGGAPVDFYYRENIEIKIPGEYKMLSDDDIIYTHHYSTTYPTIFNSHVIHGVKSVEVERAYFRLRINESFESIVEKYNNGMLLND